MPQRAEKGKGIKDLKPVHRNPKSRDAGHILAVFMRYEPGMYIRMTHMKKFLAPVAIAFALSLAAAPALAQEKTPEELARDGLAKLLSALDLFIGSIPQYETPEILPNGDIIIRRIHPEAEKTPDPAPKEKPKDSI